MNKITRLDIINVHHSILGSSCFYLFIFLPTFRKHAIARSICDFAIIFTVSHFSHRTTAVLSLHYSIGDKEAVKVNNSVIAHLATTASHGGQPIQRTEIIRIMFWWKNFSSRSIRNPWFNLEQKTRIFWMPTAGTGLKILQSLVTYCYPHKTGSLPSRPRYMKDDLLNGSQRG